MKYLLIVLIQFVLSPVLNGQNPLSTTPINSVLLDWLQGDWKGTLTSSKISQDISIKFEFVLDGEVLQINFLTDRNGTKYNGIGMITIDNKHHEIVGAWVDNSRRVYKGKGLIDGEMLSLIWYNKEGNTIQLMRQINDNQLELIIQQPDGKGLPNELKGSLKRLLDITGTD